MAQLCYLFGNILTLSMDKMTFQRHWFVTVENAAENQYSSLNHDLYIEPEAHIADIIGVPLIAAEDALKAGGRPPVSPDLGDTGDARLGHMTKLIIVYSGGKSIRIFQHMRTRAYNAHMSKEHINK